MRKSLRIYAIIAAITLMVTTILVGCNLPTPVSTSSSNPQNISLSSQNSVEIKFQASISAPLTAGDSIYLSILDEVTGLPFNQTRYIMQAEDSLRYSVTLSLNIGSVIKYRYIRDGAKTADESLFNDRQVRYRLYHVVNHATIQDVITRWSDAGYQGAWGRIIGDVKDISNGKPVPNILVTAAGAQTLTSANGTFLLEGLPPGTHNLVFYSLDGSYQAHQQGAVVAANSTTPASVQINPAESVKVIFILSVPANTPADAPIRIAGNLYQLGNTFSDLSGGVSTLASRMPSLGKLADGRYLLTLNLPAGTFLEYKYTLGDGLWSSELTPTGSLKLRQLIIPNHDVEINDVVDTWQVSNNSPIHFVVNVPSDTPPNEVVSIQFNPGFGWMEPLPMWPIAGAGGQRSWNFDLTGPLNHLTSLRYRYCRQNQCGSADDMTTMGINPDGREVDPSTSPGTIQDEVSSWAWLSSPDESANVPPNVVVSPKGSGFITGIAFQSSFHPSWEPLLSSAVNEIHNLSAGWLLLSPTWTFTNSAPLTFEPSGSHDMLYPDLVNVMSFARNQGISVGLYPLPNFPINRGEWWQNARRDYSWWSAFFERYSDFILHHATVASTTGANSLILGGDWLSPALPGGLLEDGSPSGVPQDAEALWRELISKIREHYAGTLAWALSYPAGVKNPPPFLDTVDQIYILWSASLADQPGSSVDEMTNRANMIFEQDISPLAERVAKPIVIAIVYPSISGGTTGCITIMGGGCLDYDLLSPPNPDIPDLSLNLQEQADAYNAILSAINDQAGISGYVSMGYYPAAVLQDKSISIQGKPARSVFWYWSQKFLGQ